MVSTQTTVGTEESGATGALTEFFNYFGNGDMEALVDLFHDDIDLLAAGDPVVPWTGQRHGKAAAADFLAALGKFTEPVAFTVETIIGSGSTAVALGHFAHRVLDTGKVFECDFSIRIDVTDGRISKYRIFEDSYAVGQAFRPPAA